MQVGEQKNLFNFFLQQTAHNRKFVMMKNVKISRQPLQLAGKFCGLLCWTVKFWIRCSPKINITRQLRASRFSTFIFLSIIFASQDCASAQFDKGGPQHRITWGRGNPHTSALFGDTERNVTAIVGHKARLPCQVKNLGLKDVSWIRQRDLRILTVGRFTYTTDDRFKARHPVDTEYWHLDITSVTFRDAGIYECQVSTSPKVFLPVNLNVLGIQEAEISGPREVYIRVGSTISFICEVPASYKIIGTVQWFHGPATLNYSSPRGGISLELEKTPSYTISKLFITRAGKSDSGNYTCGPQYAKSDSVIVHVVNEGEESAAAVHSSAPREIFSFLSSYLNIWEAIVIVCFGAWQLPLVNR